MLGGLAAAVLLAALPFALEVPEAVRRAMHPLEYEETIRQASRERGLEPAFVAGVIHAESRFDPGAESSQGAVGLTQILPSTAEFISRRSDVEGDLREPETNIRMGAWYLSYLQERYSGRERLALAAYNSGEGRVDEWIAEEGFDVESDIPFPETRAYVEDVLEAREAYRELYGRNLSGR